MDKNTLVQKGFTLIELLVVTAIIVLMTALILPNYRAGDKQLALQRSANKLAQDIRRAQSMALSSQEFEEEVPAGYGIYLNKNQPTQYILFADLNGDGNYDADEAVGTPLELENKVKIDELSPGSPLTIVFVPPDPTVAFLPDDDSALITLGVEGLETKVFQYAYQVTSWFNFGPKTPLASCDISPFLSDCLDTFLTSAGDPQKVYDQWLVIFYKEYQKQQTEVTVPLQKIIQVNKAGLIAIE